MSTTFLSSNSQAGLETISDAPDHPSLTYPSYPLSLENKKESQKIVKELDPSGPSTGENDDDLRKESIVEKYPRESEAQDEKEPLSQLDPSITLTQPSTGPASQTQTQDKEKEILSDPPVTQTKEPIHLPSREPSLSPIPSLSQEALMDDSPQLTQTAPELSNKTSRKSPENRPSPSKRRKIDDDGERKASGSEPSSASSSPSGYKRQKVEVVENPARRIGTSSLSDPDSSMEKDPKKSTSSQLDQVIWVDIGVGPEEIYWWPALVSRPVNAFGSVSESDVTVELIDSREKLITEAQGRKLGSFKGTRDFQPFPKAFVPSKLNPILKRKKATTETAKYPSTHSLKKAYMKAHEKYFDTRFDDAENLPDPWMCISLSQESITALRKAASQESPRKLSISPPASPREYMGKIDENEEDSCIFRRQLDVPDDEIQIPGEAVLSREKSKGEYWPACVIGYAGLRHVRKRGRASKKNLGTDIKYYRLKFCDEKEVEVPRSYFFTSDQEEFYHVKTGQVQTTAIGLKDLIEKMEKQLDRLDVILKGKSTDPDLILKHDRFLNNSKSRGQIPPDVRYGKYSEDSIQKVGEYLSERYLNADFADDRFLGLNESQRRQYVSDILVPEVIWLMTVEDHVEDAIGRLPKGSTEEEIREESKKIAIKNIQELDIVDRVVAMRVRKKNSEGFKRTLKRKRSRGGVDGENDDYFEEEEEDDDDDENENGDGDDREGKINGGSLPTPPSNSQSRFGRRLKVVSYDE